MVTDYVAVGITVTFGTLTGELIDVKGSPPDADMVDVTHQGSASNFRAFKAGLVNGGTWTLTMAFDPDAVWDVAGTSGTLRIVWPASSTKKYSATAFCKSGPGVTASLGDKMVADFTFQVSGSPNWAAT